MPDLYGFDLVTDLRMQMGMGAIAVSSRRSMGVITGIADFAGRPPIFNAMEFAYLSGQIW